jgi:hypothetical protein
MQGERDMSKEQCREHMEEAFAANFLKELMPGILHNFANPLGGIMGRAKLMQRRLDESIGKIKSNHGEVFKEMQKDFERLQADINALSDESDRFYGMFRDVVGKLQAIENRADGQINLSALWTQELRFANFYLDFKHEVDKKLILDEDTPELTGSEAGHSLSLWALIRYSLQRLRSSPVKEFHVSTTHNVTHICFEVRFSSSSLTAEEQSLLREGTLLHQGVHEEMNGLVDACSFWRACGGSVAMRHEAQTNILTVTIPYNPEK